MKSSPKPRWRGLLALLGPLLMVTCDGAKGRPDGAASSDRAVDGGGLARDRGVISATDAAADARTCLPAGRWAVGPQQALQLTSLAEDFMLVFELPPYLVPKGSGGERLLALSTIWQANCLTDINPLSDPLTVSVTSPPRCAIANYAYDFGSIAGFEGKKPSDLRDPDDPWYKAAWRRSWYANLSQHVSPGGWIFGVAHGENKGQVWLDPTDQAKVKLVDLEVYGFDTTLFPHDSPGLRAFDPLSRERECALTHGASEARYQHGDCAANYSAFVTLVRMGKWSDVGLGVASPGYRDYGPVAWPVDGYVEGNAGTGRNTVHGFGVTWGEFLYVYYVDWSSAHLLSSDPDFSGGVGVKVVRARLAGLELVFDDEAREPSGLFEAYCEGLSCCAARDPDGNGWGRAMPAGFSAKDGAVYDSLTAKGCAKTIVDALPSLSAQFSVARSTEGGLVAVHWSADLAAGKNKLELMSSSDGLEWKVETTILEVTGSADDLTMKHPNLLDATGRSSELIDPKHFYVLGAQHQPTVRVNAIPVTRSCTP
ncbi:MAG: hypothetical protein IPL40_07630 [Proteobacteria bacterium]|nr:hypothetical protein [Pseudomonadota bacterium]